MSTQLDELAQEIERARPALQEAVATLRLAARSVNDVGRLASLLQREAQDAEFEGVPNTVRPSLQDLLQRTGYVNLRAGELATRLRELHTGLTDLTGDAEAVLERTLAAQRAAAPEVATDTPTAPSDGAESAEELA
jgi:outer membrane murein-binding lipoprotein Lpp